MASALTYYPGPAGRRYWITRFVPVTATLLAITCVLVIAAALLTRVDPAISVLPGSTSVFGVGLGIGFWTIVTLAAVSVSLDTPGGSHVSVGVVPLVAAAALGGPLVAVWVALVGSTEVRELKRLPPALGVANHLHAALPVLVVTLALEPLRPSLLAAGAAPLGLAVSLLTGVVYLITNGWLALWYVARLDARRVPGLFRRQIRTYAALLSFIPLAWLAAEVYVLVAWWAVLVLGGLVAIWQLLTRQDAVYREANEDRLTGLLNRRGLEERLGQHHRSSVPVGVVYLDLDGFKPVNDRHGHDAGDRLLTTIGQRLASVVRPDDIVARMGGDEFVVVLPEIGGAGALDLVAARIRDAVAEPCLVSGRSLRVTASIGTALGSTNGLPEINALLIEADEAMFRNKASRRRRASPRARRTVGREAPQKA